MKKLLILLPILAILTSCGQNKDYTEIPLDGTDFSGSVNDVLEMVASKEYHPVVNYDNVYTVQTNEILKVYVPESLEVISGNAGNYYTLLSLDDITCFYKGGSDFSYPMQMSSPSEVEKGQKYNLKYCKDNSGSYVNLIAGDVFEVIDRVKVSIHNGDSTVTTDVKVSFELF